MRRAVLVDAHIVLPHLPQAGSEPVAFRAVLQESPGTAARLPLEYSPGCETFPTGERGPLVFGRRTSAGNQGFDKKADERAGTPVAR